MRNIIFIGQIDSTYGRGKDKVKRKTKALLTTAGTIAGGSAVGGGIRCKKLPEKIY